jgi:hypothetical protein
MELSSETQISVLCFQKEVTSSCSLLRSRATLFCFFFWKKKSAKPPESASPSVGCETVFCEGEQDKGGFAELRFLLLFPEKEGIY